MKGEKFEVEFVDGTKKQAYLVTRIKVDEKDSEYVYYAIEDDDDPNGNVSIFASKVAVIDGKEFMVNLENEDERQFAYKVFAETYKKLKEEKK